MEASSPKKAGPIAPIDTGEGIGLLVDAFDNGGMDNKGLNIGDPEEPYVGKDLRTRSFTVSDALLGSYYEGLAIDPSWYNASSPYGRPVAPSMLVTLWDFGFPGEDFKNKVGNLWARQEWEMLGPPIPGKTYDIQARVEDIYERRGRTVVKKAVLVRDRGGIEIASGYHHQSYLLAKSGGELHSGKTSKRGEFNPPWGERLKSVERRVTFEMADGFFRHSDSYHPSEESALEQGFSEIPVSGAMTLSYLSHILDVRFGKGWYEGGHLDVKFTRVVWCGEKVVCSAVIVDRLREGGRDMANLVLWVEKEDGTLAVIGDATAYE